MVKEDKGYDFLFGAQSARGMDHAVIHPNKSAGLVIK